MIRILNIDAEVSKLLFAWAYENKIPGDIHHNADETVDVDFSSDCMNIEIRKNTVTLIETGGDCFTFIKDEYRKIVID